MRWLTKQFSWRLAASGASGSADHEARVASVLGVGERVGVGVGERVGVGAIVGGGVVVGAGVGVGVDMGVVEGAGVGVGVVGVSINSVAPWMVGLFASVAWSYTTTPPPAGTVTDAVSCTSTCERPPPAA